MTRTSPDALTGAWLIVSPPRSPRSTPAVRRSGSRDATAREGRCGPPGRERCTANSVEHAGSGALVLDPVLFLEEEVRVLLPGVLLVAGTLAPAGAATTRGAAERTRHARPTPHASRRRHASRTRRASPRRSSRCPGSRPPPHHGRWRCRSGPPRRHVRRRDPARRTCPPDWSRRSGARPRTRCRRPPLAGHGHRPAHRAGDAGHAAEAPPPTTPARPPAVEPLARPPPPAEVPPIGTPPPPAVGLIGVMVDPPCALPPGFVGS